MIEKLSNKLNGLFKVAIESSPVSMIMVDVDEKIIMINNETSELFGYSKDELIGANFHILLNENIRKNHSKFHSDFLKKSEKRKMGIGTKLFARHKDNFEFPVEIGLTPVQYEGDVYVLCSIVDLTYIDNAEKTMLWQKNELEEANKKLSVMASTDPLTGIYNRRFFFQELELILNISNRENKAFSLIMLDIDNFKLLNDKYGHQNGDKIISSIAQIIKKTARKSDLAARYGGEEFCIILPNTDNEGSILIAEKLRKIIAEKKYETSQVTVSIGVSTFKLNKKGRINIQMVMNQVIAEADQALYFAKRNGKNRVVHYKNI